MNTAEKLLTHLDKIFLEIENKAIKVIRIWGTTEISFVFKDGSAIRSKDGVFRVVSGIDCIRELKRRGEIE